MGKFKYHINSKGNIERCKATKRQCPFGAERHFENNTSLSSTNLGHKLFRKGYHNIYDDAAISLHNARVREIQNLEEKIFTTLNDPSSINIKPHQNVRESIKEIEEKSLKLGKVPEHANPLIKIDAPVNDDSILFSRELVLVDEGANIRASSTQDKKSPHEGWTIQGLNAEPPRISTAWRATTGGLNNKKEDFLEVKDGAIYGKKVGSIKSSTDYLFKKYHPKEAKQNSANLIARIFSLEEALGNKGDYKVLIDNRPETVLDPEKPEWNVRSPVMKPLDYGSTTLSGENIKEMLNSPEFGKVVPDFSITVSETIPLHGVEQPYFYKAGWSLIRRQGESDPWVLETREQVEDESYEEAHDMFSNGNEVAWERAVNEGKAKRTYNKKELSINDDLNTEFVSLGFTPAEASERVSYIKKLVKETEEALNNHKKTVRVNRAAEGAKKRDVADKNAHRELFQGIGNQTAADRMFSF